MIRGPLAALVALVLSLPGPAHALGLGDIRVRSALNEPLAAQIAIVGATAEELQSLRAQLASADEFQRHGAERPPYLASVSFRIESDADGRALLVLRSSERFTDPLIDLLVEVRWPQGELTRDYVLLLDPVALVRPTPAASNPPVAAVAAAAAAPAPIAPAPAVTETVTVPASMSVAAVAVPAPAPAVHPSGTTYRVRAGDTLYDIARHAGAARGLEAQRLMVAIFRANPGAFDHNINLLRRGAVLEMPGPQDLAALDAVDVRRSVAEQMRAWNQMSAGSVPRMADPATARTPGVAAPAADGAGLAALSDRIRSLESALETQRAQLAHIDGAIQAWGHPTLPPVPVPAAHAAAQRPLAVERARLLPMTMALLLPIAALMIYRGRRRPVAPQLAPGAAASAPIPGAVAAASATLADTAPTVEMPQALRLSMPAAAPPPQSSNTEATRPLRVDEQMLQPGNDPSTVEQPRVADDATVDMDTLILDAGPSDDEILSSARTVLDVKQLQSTVLDYNLVDLDSSAPHVHMPSDLSDRPNFVERRTSIIDALRSALARDPHRPDLRMKLLETYFNTAAANRRAFEDMVRAQAREADGLTAQDWLRLATMVQELGLEMELPAEPVELDSAHCA